MAILLDLDGTLVDSVYQHVLAWDDAFREAGYEVPLWRVHSAIGMGSDRLVRWVMGRAVAEAEQISDGHSRRFLDRAETLRPTHDAQRLVDDLEDRGVPFVIATSASSATRSALLSALGREDLPTTDADDVAAAKPAPDLLVTAAEGLSDANDPAVVTLVGDSPWDAEAAGRAGMRCLAVRCGGFSEAVLRRAGAADVVDDPGALVGRL